MAQIRGRLTTKQSGRRRRGSVELLIQFADDDVVQLEYALPPSQEEAAVTPRNRRRRRARLADRIVSVRDTGVRPQIQVAVWYQSPRGPRLFQRLRWCPCLRRKISYSTLWSRGRLARIADCPRSPSQSDQIYTKETTRKWCSISSANEFAFVWDCPRRHIKRNTRGSTLGTPHEERYIRAPSATVVSRSTREQSRF